MPCYHLKNAWRSAHCVDIKTKKPVIFFKEEKVKAWPGYESLKLPCQKCIGCRLEYSRQWAMRCMHESQSHPQNCFITLTFNDNYIDPIMSLRKDTFQLFMKRLRRFISYSYLDKKKFEDFHTLYEMKFGNCPTGRVRYYHAGEYGGKCLTCGNDEEFCKCIRSKPGRPHHHAILFGFDFPDKKFKKMSPTGNRVYESDYLNILWSDPKTKESYGFSEIQEISFDACAYVARYCTKKLNGEWTDKNGNQISADEHYTIEKDGSFYLREKEFATMSRHPGIGLNWYKKYNSTDVWPGDKIFVRKDLQLTPPRYYGNQLEKDNPAMYISIKEKRLKSCKDNPDNTPERLAVREKVKLAQIKSLKRKLV